MRQSAVFIATTEQPVRVLRLVEAPHQRQSVACIGLRTRKAGISDRYHDFVSHECGVVARATGCETYRLDLSRDIESGDSWQLGTLIAHAVAGQDALASAPDDAPDELPGDGTLLWATGEVDADRKVHAVADVERKLTVSRPLFERAAAAGVPVRVYLPAGNDGPSVQDCLAACADGHPDFQWRLVERAPHDAGEWDPETRIEAPDLGDQDSPGAPDPRPRMAGARSRRAMLAVVAAAVLAVAALLAVRTDSSQAQAPSARGTAAIEGDVVVSVARDGHCFGERRTHGDGPVTLSWRKANRIVVDEPVCVLEFTFGNTGPAAMEVVSLAGTPPESLRRVTVAPGERRPMSVPLYLPDEDPPTDFTLRATWTDGVSAETSVTLVPGN